jgi:hypothetical protein
MCRVPLSYAATQKQYRETEGFVIGANSSMKQRQWQFCSSAEQIVIWEGKLVAATARTLILLKEDGDMRSMQNQIAIWQQHKQQWKQLPAEVLGILSCKPNTLKKSVRKGIFEVS